MPRKKRDPDCPRHCACGAELPTGRADCRCRDCRRDYMKVYQQQRRGFRVTSKSPMPPICDRHTQSLSVERQTASARVRAQLADPVIQSSLESPEKGKTITIRVLG